MIKPNPHFSRLSIIAVMLVAGCASGGLSVNRLKFGATPEEVRDEIGTPDRSEISKDDPHQEVWVYAMEGTRCTLTFTLGHLFARPRCQSDEEKEEVQERTSMRESWHRQSEAQRAQNIKPGPAP